MLAQPDSDGFGPHCNYPCRKNDFFNQRALRPDAVAMVALDRRECEEFRTYLLD